MQVPPVRNQPYLLSCILATCDCMYLLVASCTSQAMRMTIKADINWNDNRPDRQDQGVLRDHFSKLLVEIQANSRRNCITGSCRDVSIAVFDWWSGADQSKVNGHSRSTSVSSSSPQNGGPGPGAQKMANQGPYYQSPAHDLRVKQNS